MNNNRLKFIDMAKGVGIILVLFGHLIYTNTYVLVWISAFHMPVFFVLSGITLRLGTKTEEDVKGRISKKARALLIPYMWFSVIYFVVDIGNLYLSKITMKEFINNALASITFSGKSVMWFVTALFFSQVILISLQSKLSDAYVIIVVAVLAAAGCLCAPFIRQGYENYTESILMTALLNFPKILARTAIVTPFTAAGYYGKKWYSSRAEVILNKPVRALIGILCMVLCVAIALTNWSVDTNNMILNNPLFYYIGGFSGSISVIALCSVLPAVKPLEIIGKYSLVIMAVHLDLYVLWAGLQVGEIAYSLCGITQVLTVVTVICTLILGCVAGFVIERFFPFILGRKRQVV